MRGFDRVLVVCFALSVVALLATIVIAVLSYVNPSVPPLSLPTARLR